MEWSEDYLDFCAAVMFGILLLYHPWLVHRIRNHPETTYLGCLLDRRMLSLDCMLLTRVAERGVFMAEILSNTASANTYLSLAVIFFSLVGGLGSAHSYTKPIIYGDSTAEMEAVKSIALSVVAMFTIFCFKEGGDAWRHATSLVTLPNSENRCENIREAVVQGFVFCEVGGHRSFYLCLALIAWFFGPIPMIVTCLVILVRLYTKDKRTFHSEERSPSRNELSPV